MKARIAESRKRHDDMMRKYDKNGNGRIDDSEKKALKEGLRQEAAKRAAQNKEASRKKMEEYRRRKEISRYDRNVFLTVLWSAVSPPSLASLRLYPRGQRPCS